MGVAEADELGVCPCLRSRSKECRAVAVEGEGLAVGICPFACMGKFRDMRLARLAESATENDLECEGKGRGGGGDIFVEVLVEV
jgi:hypothetical protein